MTAYDFLVELKRRGVTFEVDGDHLRLRDPDRRLTAGERGLISSMKSLIRGLLLTELPSERAEKACEAFSAALGVALCRSCGFGYGDHFWRTIECAFFIGEPASAGHCQRCGVPWLEHLGALKKSDAS